MKKQPKREARRKKITEIIKDTGTKPTPEVIGVSRATLWRDLTALESQGQLAISEQDRREMVKAQYEVLLKMERAAVEGTLDPDVINAWNRVRESIARLLGLNAPVRSEAVNVNVEADPQKLGPYQWFCFISRDLSFEEIKSPISEVCDRLRAEKEPEPMPQPPKDSPLWHPTPKELTP
jgi:hypothetical protein